MKIIGESFEIFTGNVTGNISIKKVYNFILGESISKFKKIIWRRIIFAMILISRRRLG